MCLTSKSKREFQRELNCQILSQKTIGQTLANLLRIHLGSSICIIYSKGDKSFCSSLELNCNQETVCLLDCENFNQETGCLLNCEFLEHKGKGSLGCSEVVKRNFTKLVKISSGLLEDWT